MIMQKLSKRFKKTEIPTVTPTLESVYLSAVKPETMLAVKPAVKRAVKRTIKPAAKVQESTNNYLSSNFRQWIKNG